MVGQKDHTVGVLCNSLFGDVFFSTGIGKPTLHGNTCAGHKSHGNIVGLQVVIDIRACERQGLAVQPSGNGDDIQVWIRRCLVKNEKAVGQDGAVFICDKINQVQARCAGIDINGVVFGHKLCGAAADFFLFFRKTSASFFIGQKRKGLWCLKCCYTAVNLHNTAALQKDIDISSDGIFGYVECFT